MNGSDGLRWRKSTFSGANGGACVEVAGRDGMILVRDTKDHGRGPVHRYTPEEWRAFVVGVRNGEFDLDKLGRLPRQPTVTASKAPARKKGTARTK